MNPLQIVVIIAVGVFFTYQVITFVKSIRERKRRKDEERKNQAEDL